ncbi:MAG: hypothetical protein ACREDV_12880 [Methylocella sp.]
MKPLKFGAPPPARLPSMDPLPSSDAAWLDKLDLALEAISNVFERERLGSLGEDRPKGAALEAAYEKLREARSAAELLFFGEGRVERLERRDADSRRAAAKEALASAEKDRAEKLAAGAGDQELDAAELAVKRAGRGVEREIAAAAALEKQEAAARKAALDAAWDRLWPPYLELQNELIGHLRAAVALNEKLCRINGFVQQTGACPAIECMPWLGDEFFLTLAAVEDHCDRLKKAGERNNLFVTKRSAAA